MGLSYWFRVVMMAGVLAAVLFTMRKLNRPHSPIEALLPTGASAALNLCPTRILWVESAHGSLHIEEEGSKWMRLLSGDQKQLDTIAVEKWFSQFCMADSTAVAGDNEKFEPALKIGYLGRKPATLSRSANGNFELGDIRFKSQAVSQLLNALPVLPLAVEPGNAPPANHE